MSDLKIINIKFEDPKEEKETINTEKHPKKRAITKTALWKENEKEISIEKQKEYVKELKNGTIQNKTMCSVISKQIRQKISGYRNQDVLKKKLEKEKLITFEETIQLLDDSDLSCYYCKENVYVLYENVRESKQWSLDRLDNDLGHNSGNLVISCLTCNLRRKTMYHERFAFTKQLNIVKKV